MFWNKIIIIPLLKSWNCPFDWEGQLWDETNSHSWCISLWFVPWWSPSTTRHANFPSITLWPMEFKGYVPCSSHGTRLEVACASKALKLYTTLSLTSTTNCFAPMFKQKLDRCMINCDDRLRHFSETLTNWDSMSSIKNSCIRDRWLCMTCSNNKVQTLIFVKQFVH